MEIPREVDENNLGSSDDEEMQSPTVQTNKS
jgi:hypothetical protein